MSTDFRILLLTALAVSSACTSGVDGPSPVKETGKLHFEVAARAPETKTSIAGSEKPGEPGKYVYTPLWGEDDDVAALFSANAPSTPKEKLSNTLDAGETALFTGDTSAPVTGDVSVFYPYSAWTGGMNGYATVKSSQSPALNSFDPSCDILCAEPESYSESEGTVSVSGLIFHRLTGVLRIELTGVYAEGNHIRSLKFTAPEGTILAGNFGMDFANARISGTSSGTNVVTASYADGPEIGSGSVFLSLLPCVIRKDGRITVEIRTESYDIVKTVTLREDMTVPEGGVAVLRLSVSDAHCTSLLDREGWMTTQIYTGLKWHNFEGTDPVTSNPQIVNVIEADLPNAPIQLSFVYSAVDKKVSEIAASGDALAVTNATYGAGQEGIVHIKTDGVVRRTIDEDVAGYTAWKHKAAVWFDGMYGFGFYNYHSNVGASKAAYEGDKHPNLYSGAPLLIYGGSKINLVGFGGNSGQNHPRTVLAVTQSGRLLLMTVDGRLSTAKGMTCPEVQDFLERYFAPAYAINMDGGGSTAMYVHGMGIVDYPCHGTAEDAEDVSRDHTAERSVPSFFVISPVVKSGFEPVPVDEDDNEWYYIR